MGLRASRSASALGSEPRSSIGMLSRGKVGGTGVVACRTRQFSHLTFAWQRGGPQVKEVLRAFDSVAKSDTNRLLVRSGAAGWEAALQPAAVACSRAVRGLG